MNTKKTLLLQSLLALTPLVYLFILWNTLPEKLPVHFNAQSVADRWGNKTEVLFMSLFLAGISIGVAALLLYINKVDPKQSARTDLRLMKKMSWILTFFLAVLNTLILYHIAHYDPLNPKPLMVKYVFILITLLIAALGNVMNNVKPNYFVGIRTPWTLSSEENWRKTHHLASKLWFFGGIVMLVLHLILPVQLVWVWFIMGLILLTVTPIVYSIWLYREEKKQLNE